VNLVLLAIGGACGAIGRYLLGLAMMKKYAHPPIPVAMLVVNVCGSFGLGLFLGAYYQTFPPNGDDDIYFLSIGVGFFGAFTTFSTFSVEAVQLLEENKYKPFVYYVSLSILGSIIAFVLSYLAVVSMITP
jgi:fluoride exporter